MLQGVETDRTESQPEPEPAAQAPQQAKAGSLTGAFVQRGRDRAPQLREAPAESAPCEPAEPPLAAVAVPLPDAPAARASRWADALFMAACCAAFFAAFLFVLHF